MKKARTTVALDVLRADKVKAARAGKGDSEVIEGSPPHDFGFDDIADAWARIKPATEDEGLELARDELRAVRRERRSEIGPVRARLES